jgi:hypothetical protein
MIPITSWSHFHFHHRFWYFIYHAVSGKSIYETMKRKGSLFHHYDDGVGGRIVAGSDCEIRMCEVPVAEPVGGGNRISG